MSEYQPYTAMPPHASPALGSAPPFGPAMPPFVPKGLAITGMVTGIVGLGMFWVPLWGPLVSLVGLIFGIVAKAKQQPRGLSLTGIITGSMGIVVGVALWTWLLIWAAHTLQQAVNDPAIQQQFLELLEREAAQFP